MNHKFFWTLNENKLYIKKNKIISFLEKIDEKIYDLTLIIKMND
jgi:hypothetical protein